MIYDVVIAGAGVMGCATAVHLLRADQGLDVTVIEPDLTYSRAATPLASGGVRQLFSSPENIAMSRYTLEVIATWREFADTDAPDLLWRRNGYLFIGGDATALQRNLGVQLAHGVRARWLEPEELADRFQQISPAGLAGAVLSEDDGWLDPSALLDGLLRTARRLGAKVRRDRVVDFEVSGSQVRSVILASGARLNTRAVVNTAGCWAADLAATAGMPVPVEPMERQEHHVDVHEDIDDLPFVKDPAGLAVRPQGQGLTVGLVDFAHLGPVPRDHFENAVWPALAHRFPALDRLRLRATSVGHYDQNRFDGNMIIGNFPGRLDNFYLACGFSGHGLMHALAVGRALSELVLHSEYRSIDLTRMEYQRVLDHRPYAENGIR